VAELLDVAEDFEEIADTSGPATCQANPETSLSERTYAGPQHSNLHNPNLALTPNPNP